MKSLADLFTSDLILSQTHPFPPKTMKPKSTLRNFLSLAGSSLLAISSASG